MLSAAADHRGKIVFLTGAVATGKTELLHRFGERAVRAGATWVHATASRAERNHPYSILTQFFQSTGLPPELDRLIAADTWDGVAPSPGTSKIPSELLHGLCARLFALSSKGVVVVSVDDVQYADPFVLQWLSYLSRRLVSARVLLVLTMVEDPQPADPMMHTEFLRLPHSRLIHIPPLSRRGVSEIVDFRANGEPGAYALHEQFYEVSGGNPMILHALLDDHFSTERNRPDQPASEPFIGGAFKTTVQAMLHRAHPDMLAVARGLAIAGDRDPAPILAPLLDLDLMAADQALGSLTQSGLLAAGRFRHELAREAVLADLDPGLRRDLHLRAANLLHDNGAEPRAVARHLVDADHAGAPWALQVLLEATDQAVAENSLSDAVRCLRHAAKFTVDPEQEAVVTAALSRTEWRLDPLIPLRHIPDLMAALTRGTLSGTDARRLVQLLLWHGRREEAATALELIDRAEHGGAIEAWLGHAHPSLASRDADCADSSSQIPATEPLQVQADRALRMTLSHACDDQTAGLAERILHGSMPESAAMDGIVASLFTLIYADELSRAASWCETMLHKSAVRCSPTWQAIFYAVRAEIAVRQGYPAQAESLAETALSKIGTRGWGTSIGLPMGALLMAQIQLRKYDNAAEQLSRTFPADGFNSRYGLHFLHARGHYYLATDRLRDALADFLTCGQLMERWQIDRPGLVPWRIGAASVHLAAGNRDAASNLALEQIGRPGGDRARTGGIALRVLAAASEVKERPELLRRAVAELQECGDRMELALALNDLSHAFHALGESGRARTVAHRSWNAIKEARHPGRRETTRPRPPGLEDSSLIGPTPATSSVLSEAEQRVAELAALGFTNRQISERLYVTVSTVEQHLTRVYRKLKLNGRTELLSAFEVSYH